MTDLFEHQSEQRQKHLDAILESNNPRKIIVAGPGTGKSFTFGEIFRRNVPSKYLALTFIRKLVNDMEDDLGNLAEVRTFHSYCKGLLHKRFGGVDLVPYLTEIIEEDAEAVDLVSTDFRNSFQNLREEAPEIEYYLQRGAYYRAVSFDDSVFKVYQAVKNGNLELPSFDHIVIDEFQDFNRLETAFIDLLQENSPVLIVGDDDQAVYSQRNSSPDFLRNKWRSGDYEVFELPYCSRCPSAVVEATSGFIDAVLKSGGFQSRIPKHFVPFLKDKASENEQYPQIISARTANIAGMSKFIQLAINKISEAEIVEAHEKNYACVLIVGSRQYLNPLHKNLTKTFPQAAFRQSKSGGYSLADGYSLLLQNEDSNLAWRVFAGHELPPVTLNPILIASHDGTPFKDLLPQEFVDKHSSVGEMLKNSEVGDAGLNELNEILGDDSTLIANHFFPAEDTEPPEPDISKPSILLSSFEGCKGLSAGHVFIVGMNQGVVPRLDTEGKISDIEYSKFIVAMTRTRKLLYLLSNRWDYKPGGGELTPSVFLEMIPSKLIKNGGYLKAEKIEKFLEPL